jgi:(1->4)-alpha-D-glucan 1-alpha-D-glucosylmutase
MDRQHWRLAWWRTAGDEINWRRFFDVTELCAIRMQDRAVFEIVHGTLLRLYGEGLIDGLRIDHVDGLADPRAYCRHLRTRLRRERPREAAWVVVEKILAPDERLPADWQVDGTSGYSFMNEVGALLHDPRGRDRLSRFWQRQDGGAADFSEEEERARRRIPRELFGAEFEACAHALHAVARQSPATRDWTQAAIRRVLVELIAHFPVYRTYADGRGRGEEDRRIMERAVQAAEPACRPAERALLHRIDAWLGGEAPKDVRPVPERRARLRAIARFQQLTSPVAAKSVEDTAFYRHGRLLSRNEVGADPRQFCLSADEYHAVCADRRQRYPRALLATATHDHKRGEDVRARLSVISETADAWVEAVERWRRFNESLHTTLADGRVAPDAVDEYLLYQMMVGTWPLETELPMDYVERLATWQLKALREAKRHSSWNAPDAEYEDGCRRFLERALDRERRDAPFREAIASLVGEIAPTGAVKGLTQALLRMTCPGIPDLYQGTDFWDLSMVDPDNRRTVDYAARARMLDEAQATASLVAEDRWRDGAIKQRLVARVLRCRASDPELFALGQYQGLPLEGRLANQFVAFVRRYRRRCVLVVVPLHVHPFTRRARDLRMPVQAVLDTAVVLPEDLRAGDWYDALEQRPLDSAAASLAGDRLSLARVLDPWPVALLRGTGG